MTSKIQQQHHNTHTIGPVTKTKHAVAKISRSFTTAAKNTTNEQSNTCRRWPLRNDVKRKLFKKFTGSQNYWQWLREGRGSFVAGCVPEKTIRNTQNESNDCKESHLSSTRFKAVTFFSAFVNHPGFYGICAWIKRHHFEWGGFEAATILSGIVPLERWCSILPMILFYVPFRIHTQMLTTQLNTAYATLVNDIGISGKIIYWR